MMTDEESAGKGNKDDDWVAPDAQPEMPSEDEGRRDFIKKLPYVAPVIQTFLFSEGTLPNNVRHTINFVNNTICRVLFFDQ